MLSKLFFLPKEFPSSEACMYFVAGALLPTTLALYFWQQKQHLELQIYNDDDEDSEDELFESAEQPIMGENSSSTWNISHAPYKMIFCVNMELGMQKGKMMAQCGHATLGAYQRALRQCPTAVQCWQRTGCAKIAVKVPTTQELHQIAAAARSRDIPIYLVEDAGRTQIAAGSQTVLGLGPAPVSVFEGVTDHLKLM